MMQYPKHYLIIRDKQYDIGNNFVIEEDLDKCFNTMTFDIAYIEGEKNNLEWSTKDIGYHDRIQLYFNFFNTPDERDSATIEDMELIFDGYIEENPLSENKSDGIKWTGIKCNSTFGLAYERTTQTDFFNANMSLIIEKAIDELNLGDFIPAYFLDYNISDNLILNISSTKYFGEVCDNIKQKYAFQIFQKGDGTLYITTPAYFNQQSIEAYEYDLESNVFNINYGNISTNINCVCVIGNNGIGIAYDPIAYQLMRGVRQDELQTNITPDPIYLYPRYIYRRDLEGDEACQDIARNKLVEYAKNYTISFKTIFVPTQKLGEVFIIKNSKKIPENQKWIIKRRTITINKEDISCEITGYSNSISDFPDDILLDATGILDTDILNVDKDDSTTSL